MKTDKLAGNSPTNSQRMRRNKQIARLSQGKSSLQRRSSSMIICFTQADS
ncbi:MAG: hypothetical protein J7L25_02840 [Deltaproteobacteria bacterium]|nr:hypothetical protein [Candidatus Tharpella aukensis]